MGLKSQNSLDGRLRVLQCYYAGSLWIEKVAKKY